MVETQSTISAFSGPEAATKLGDQAERLAPNQPWQQIRALGNRLRHDYDQVDRATIWAVVEGDLASLRADIPSVSARPM